MSCFLSCHCLDLLFRVHLVTHSSLQSELDMKKTKTKQARHEKNNLKTINWKQYSYKKLIWWGNWPCSSAVEVSHTAHCYHIPTAEKKLTHQETIVRGLTLPLCVCVCVCVCGGGYGGNKDWGGGGGGADWMRRRRSGWGGGGWWKPHMVDTCDIFLALTLIQ